MHLLVLNYILGKILNILYTIYNVDFSSVYNLEDNSEI